MWNSSSGAGRGAFACGSGSAAPGSRLPAARAPARPRWRQICAGLTERKVTVVLDGGELEIEWRESDDHVLMTGPVGFSFGGEVDIKALLANA